MYYSVESEEKQITPKKGNTSKIVAIAITVIAVVLVIVMICSTALKSTKTREISDGKLSFEVSETWQSYESPYVTGWNFYKYINTVPPLETNELKTQTASYDQYPAYLNISHYEVDKEKISSIEDVQSSMKEYINSLETIPEQSEETISKIKNGYDMLTIRMYFKENPEQIEYLFYVLNGENMACIDTYSFNMNDEGQIKNHAEQIASTLKWQE